MKRRCAPASLPRQRGAALAVILILLLVMTLLGLVSVRVATLQERMSGTLYDRSLAFQAAEAALRAGEESVSNKPVLATGCTSGRCGFPNAAATPVWEVAGNWNTAPSIPDLEDTTAKYIVEMLADQVPVDITECTTFIDVSVTECGGVGARYRITALSREAGRADVMLQSIYAVP